MVNSQPHNNRYKTEGNTLRCKSLLSFLMTLLISGCATVNIPETGLMTPGYAAMASKVYPEITGANGYAAHHNILQRCR